MFGLVSKKKYDKMYQAALNVCVGYRRRIIELEAELANRVPSQFTQDEIAHLIRLCHPDRHGGTGREAIATTITKKLLILRG